MAVRAWRDFFARLRAPSTAPLALEEFFAAPFSPKALLASAARELPAEQVVEDIVTLMELATSKLRSFFGPYDVAIGSSKIYSLIVDANLYASVLSRSMLLSSFLCFLQHVIQISLDGIIVHADSPPDSKEMKCIAESLQVLSQCLHDHGDRISGNDVEILCISILNLIKCWRLFNTHMYLQKDMEIQRLAFLVLGNVLGRPGSSLSSGTWAEMVKVLRGVLESITSEGQLVQDLRTSRIYNGILRCVQLTLSDMKGSITEHVCLPFSPSNLIKAHASLLVEALLLGLGSYAKLGFTPF